MIYNGTKTDWSLIQSVIIQVINKIAWISLKTATEGKIQQIFIQNLYWVCLVPDYSQLSDYNRTALNALMTF